MPTAIFQGILTIPVFKTPYTVPPLNSINGAPMSLNASDSALFSISSMQENFTDAYYYGMNWARVIRFNPANYTQVDLGNVGQGVSGGAQINGGWLSQGNAAYFPGANTSYGGVGTNQTQCGCWNVGVGAGVVNNSAPNMYLWGVGANTNILPSPFFGPLPMQNVRYQVMEIPGIAVPGQAMMLTSATGGLQTLAGFCNPFNGSGYVQNPPATNGPLSYSQWGLGFIIPDRSTGNNIWWGINNLGNQIKLVSVGMFYSILSGNSNFVFSQNADSLTFDNAAINTVFAAQNLRFNPTANGVWMTATNGVTGFGEYYISKDGTKYWQIAYANYSGLAIADPATEPYWPTRFIDVSGTFWYTGRGGANTGAQGLQPLYSIGINIPFNTFQLPQIPPLSFPCWSDCLARVGGNPGNLALIV
jgi:hypothetical protein